MNILSVYLLVSVGLSLTVALKTPTLCEDNKGNSFVCTVIAKVNDKDSYPSQFSINANNITVAKNGQSDFFEALQSLSILGRSLRNQSVEEMPNSQDKQWSRFLIKANETLAHVNYKTLDLYYTAVTSIRRFQSSLNDSNLSTADRIAETTAKAMTGMQYESDRQLVLNYANVHYQDMKQCWNSFTNDLESLQNKTRVFVEEYYNSMIDLLDQMGKCVESGPEARCARDAERRLISLISLPVKFSVQGFKFSMMATRKIEKYPCTVKAVLKFTAQIKKITKTAKTTTSGPSRTTTTSTTAATFTTTATPTTAAISTTAATEDVE